MNDVTRRIVAIHHLIIAAEMDFDRSKSSVQLLAVSKKQPLTKIRQAYAAGVRHFAENFVQEALEKIGNLEDADLVWHFIGAIQANKTQKIAENFSWVHTVCREKIAKRLSEQRPSNKPPLNICIQVNISEQKNKSGIALGELPDLAKSIKDLPNLRLRGLMCIPAQQDDFTQQRQPFAKLRQAFVALNHQGFALDALSMGMTNDLRAAIAEGATIVRVGTGIFGVRGGGKANQI